MKKKNPIWKQNWHNFRELNTNTHKGVCTKSKTHRQQQSKTTQAFWVVSLFSHPLIWTPPSTEDLWSLAVCRATPHAIHGQWSYRAHPTHPYITLHSLTHPYRALHILTHPYLTYPYTTLHILTQSYPTLHIPTWHILTQPYPSLHNLTHSYTALNIPTETYTTLHSLTQPYTALHMPRSAPTGRQEDAPVTAPCSPYGFPRVSLRGPLPFAQPWKGIVVLPNCPTIIALQILWSLCQPF